MRRNYLLLWVKRGQSLPKILLMVLKKWDGRSMIRLVSDPGVEKRDCLLTWVEPSVIVMGGKDSAEIKFESVDKLDTECT